MRKFASSTAVLLLMWSPVMAADLDVGDLRQTSEYNWTGFYAGASFNHADANDTEEDVTLAPGFTIDIEAEGDGFGGGIFAGYMHQFDRFVIGAEYEYIDYDIQYSAKTIGLLPVDIDDQHLIKARIGYAFDRIQLYGLVGAAYTSTNIDTADWTTVYGAGLDVAVTDNLIVGGQYLYSEHDEFDGDPLEGEFENWSARVAWKF